MSALPPCRKFAGTFFKSENYSIDWLLSIRRLSERGTSAEISCDLKQACNSKETLGLLRRLGRNLCRQARSITWAELDKRGKLAQIVEVEMTDCLFLPMIDGQHAAQLRLMKG